MFPVEPRGKKPLVKGWQNAASARSSRIKQLWADAPRDANIGLACGASDIVAIDIDDPATLDRLPGSNVDRKTWTVETAQGVHLLRDTPSGREV